MGSWYNLEGTLLNACISNKCGTAPQPIQITSSTSPAEISAWMSKKQEYESCVATCKEKKFSLGGIVQASPVSAITDTRPQTRPLEKQDGSNLELTGAPTGISKNTMLIGIGVVAVVAFFALRK